MKRKETVDDAMFDENLNKISGSLINRRNASHWHNQVIITGLLADFDPPVNKDFDAAVKEYKQSLERRYPLCSICRKSVQKRIEESAKMLRSDKIPKLSIGHIFVIIFRITQQLILTLLLTSILYRNDILSLDYNCYENRNYNENILLTFLLGPVITTRFLIKVLGGEIVDCFLLKSLNILILSPIILSIMAPYAPLTRQRRIEKNNRRQKVLAMTSISMQGFLFYFMIEKMKTGSFNYIYLLWGLFVTSFVLSIFLQIASRSSSRDKIVDKIFNSKTSLALEYEESFNDIDNTLENLDNLLSFSNNPKNRS
ncbi:hypothetical protein ROZALSC1DRAFT_27329 [Rozella allomycis CSF55]|uniref:Uncharacterized protein n=1 Tax=Rozella allomycis (strain CSF55) TaxID=988480 RepID=A0A4P9YNF6_ROZAC|nr:hypothetical protein ROZALSC1DRAFT_27329 [Rozella allomycis CSF55]